MEKKLIGRGALSGGLAGLVTFVFARIFAEPIIQQAIDYESGRDAMQNKLDKLAGHPVATAGPDIFSRTIQADVGIGAGLIMFGAAMGVLVAVAYVIAVGRTGKLRARTIGVLVPAFGFIGVFLIPFAKYPANPPAIGHPDTIRDRGALYLIMVFFSCVFLFLAVYYGQKLVGRFTPWTASIVMGAAYLVAIGIVMAILPSVGHLHANLVEFGRHATETPLPLKDAKGTIVYPGFPADVLAQFRIYSVAAQGILWALIALIFAPQAERLLEPGAVAARKTAPHKPDRSVLV
jgi:hypothetical protein